MKKIISSILIAIVVLQLFAPFSVGVSDKKIAIEKNQAEAKTTINEETIKASDLNPLDSAMRNAVIKKCITDGPQQEYCFQARWIITDGKLYVVIYTIGVDKKTILGVQTKDDYSLEVKITDSDGKNFNPEQDTFNKTYPKLASNVPKSIINTDLLSDDGEKILVNEIKEDVGTKATFTGASSDTYDGYRIENKTPIEGLLANTSYTITVKLKKSQFAGEIIGGDIVTFPNVQYIEGKQTSSQSTVVGNTGTDNTVATTGNLPACGLGIIAGSPGTPLGCLAQGLYYVFFVPTSAIFGLTGKALDITLMFSISDASYRSSFVTEGWGIVRDFCNMFFIFVMLYIAIGTILNLSGVKTKEMIVNVVIIGLLINFSLLATQIIIDTSNILTRVFYNTNTIATGAADSNGKVTAGELGDFGEIKLSEAIVSKVDPQKLIMEAQKVSALPIRGQANNEDRTTTDQGITTGSFILVIILATAVNIFGIMAFFSCAIIFVARVVGLWLAMILAPIAFFSYTVPKLQDMEMIGWKHWWPETLKLAFLAPIFAFFMYIIVAFMGKGLDLISADGRTGLSFVVAIVLPFIFIMVLLTKAKDMAKDMSGKIGQTMSKAGESVGKYAVGAVGGAALGLGAGALRGTVGRIGSSIANSESLKASEAKGGIAGFGAKTLRNIGGAAGRGNMDIRGIKVGGKSLDSIGFKIGKASDKSYDKMRVEKVAKRQKRAKELEVGEDSEQTQAVRQAEAALDGAKASTVINAAGETVSRQGEIGRQTAEVAGAERELAKTERIVAIVERTLKDAETALLAAKTTPQKMAAQAVVDKAKMDRDAVIKGGVRADGTVVIRETSRDGQKDIIETMQVSIKDLNTPIVKADVALKNAQNVLITANRERRVDYAKTIQGGWSQTVNFITTGSKQVNIEREAANKILGGIQPEKK